MEMELKVLKTLQFGDKLLVIYDWMEFPDPKAVDNLCAYDADGGRLWIAKGLYPGDFFVGVSDNKGVLIGTTWSCFGCTLDPETGEIIDSVFTK